MELLVALASITGCSFIVLIFGGFVRSRVRSMSIRRGPKRVAVVLNSANGWEPVRGRRR